MRLLSKHRALALSLALFAFGSVSLAEDKAEKKHEPVSYYKQIRPIFQAHCQGCHQPAKAQGKYVMTEFSRLLSAGESEEPAIVPKNAEKSNLLALITPENGKAEMPKGKPTLAESDIDLIKRWIVEGAVDDTPANAAVRYDREHPPVYTRPPVVTSIDYSPDGKLLAVAGFHEVLLLDAATDKLVNRLVGMSERIESVRFSPNGEQIAVAGGLPGRMGEIQIWGTAKGKLNLSVPVTYDTVYGVSWSPDAKLIAFGCGDNSVRAIDSRTGEQVLFQGAHTDWAHDTVFSADGTHIASAGRDGTAKLTEVATQRFVDNITSITPGALKGGVASVARHPTRDEVVIGGSDGVAKVYRMHRLTKRVIGDDANAIRIMPPAYGRIVSVAVSKDGKRIAAGSALDNQGEVNVYSYEFNTDLPDEIRGIVSKVASSQSAEEKEKLKEYLNKDVKQIAKTPIAGSGIYAVAFRPDGKEVAASGSDGRVRIIETETGKIVREFVPVPLSKAENQAVAQLTSPAAPKSNAKPETLPEGAYVVSLDVVPNSIQLTNRYDYVQLLVTGRLSTGDSVDVTRMVKTELSAPIVDVSPTGVVRPKAAGKATIKLSLGDQAFSVPVQSTDVSPAYPVDFVRDVNPVLSKMGCNQGTCHGAAQGKAGFKLSLRGYDPLFDVRALTDDLASRRANVAAPDNSLSLMKGSGAVAHVGGQLTKPGEPYYEIVRSWIASGAKLDTATPKVVKLEVAPTNPIVQKIGSKQQVRILATYADGKVRDVTLDAFVESGNTEVATTDRTGLMTTIRRGEAPLLVRYEGNYAATTLTVMGNRDGYVWETPPGFNKIDELTAEKWKRMKIKPSGLCSDTEFLRRIYIDLTGLPPSAEDVRKFLADRRDTQVKRDEIVDKLVGSDDYVEYWTNKWADLLQVNRKFLGTDGSAAFRGWIRNEVAKNTPYDQFVYKIVSAVGATKDNPATNYFKILREAAPTMENTTHLFLAVRFNCNKCHDHPFERWTQDQYYQTAAYFAQTGLKADNVPNNPTIGGSAVEGGKPTFEVIYDMPTGDIKHDRTGQVSLPKFPYEADFKKAEKATRRQELASWITSADNQYFAKSYVNRLWGYMFGVGIMEPIDDIRAGNPPTNPELLDYLTKQFIESGFNVQHVVKLICKSRTYQLSVETNKWNEDDKINYSHATARRLPAEVLYDTIYRVMGSTANIPGVKPGTRAAALPDSGVDLPSGFLGTFGRPVRESACECERSGGLQMGPVMALISGPTVAEAIADPKNKLAELSAKEKDNAKLINELFLQILNRPADEKEIAAALKIFQTIDDDHAKLLKEWKEREAYIAPIRDKQEKDREVAIAKATADVAAYEKQIAPRVAKEEENRKARIEKETAELKKYEERLPDLVKGWEARQAGGTQWIPLTFKNINATGGVKLVQQPDGSVMASVDKEKKKSDYTLIAETDLTKITGIRLEVLPDEKLPRSGPGLAPDGNFVINEFDVSIAPKGQRQGALKVDLQRPMADFTQENFAAAQLLDGARSANNGWAIGGGTGVVHWVTLETRAPIGKDGGSLLTFKMTQNFNQPGYSVGKFRISVTTGPLPLGLSLAEELREILAVLPDQRTDAHRAHLLKYYRTIDAGLRARNKALADARQPLPIDPKLQEKRDHLALVSKPVPVDPKLAQLRRDSEMSTKLMGDQRLTGVQDLAWALINSPEFLFNH